MTEKRKLGRPTEDPKPHKVSAWVNDETIRILDDYCKSKGICRPEGLRQAIRCLRGKA